MGGDREGCLGLFWMPLLPGGWVSDSQPLEPVVNRVSHVIAQGWGEVKRNEGNHRTGKGEGLVPESQSP